MGSCIIFWYVTKNARVAKVLSWNQQIPVLDGREESSQEIVSPVSIPDCGISGVLSVRMSLQVLFQYAVHHGVVKDEERVIGSSTKIKQLSL